MHLCKPPCTCPALGSKSTGRDAGGIGQHHTSAAPHGCNPAHPALPANISWRGAPTTSSGHVVDACSHRGRRRPALVQVPTSIQMYTMLTPVATMTPQRRICMGLHPHAVGGYLQLLMLLAICRPPATCIRISSCVPYSGGLYLEHSLDSELCTASVN